MTGTDDPPDWFDADDLRVDERSEDEWQTLSRNGATPPDAGTADIEDADWFDDELATIGTGPALEGDRDGDVGTQPDAATGATASTETGTTDSIETVADVNVDEVSEGRPTETGSPGEATADAERSRSRESETGVGADSASTQRDSRPDADVATDSRVQSDRRDDDGPGWVGKILAWLGLR